MFKADLERAVICAEEFLERAKALENEATNPNYTYITPSKLTASVRRQSMELTRALADLRNPKY